MSSVISSYWEVFPPAASGTEAISNYSLNENPGFVGWVEPISKCRVSLRSTQPTENRRLAGF